MDKFDRIFHLHAILSSRRTAIPLEDLMARLECSKSTLHRTINALKDYLHAPVVFDANAGGYKYAKDAFGETYELPGLWFTPRELQALAIMQRLLKDAGGGLLEEHLAPLARRLNELMRHQRLNLGEAASRLRFPSIGARRAGKAFDVVASATLQRRKLWIEYHARSTDERSERTISPQRITHYRETWYLDAWDEERNALRIFSIDRIVRATVLDAPAFDVPEAELDDHYASAYGIFGGKADKVAVLRFTRERARWVADENWHPQQESTWLPDGRYELRIPYREPRELVMDIMRHGRHVEVVAPDDLRQQVHEELRQAISQYSK
ncbi:MAG: YafY family transcriptional regulator [Steroidobacteraceae bacterium]|nr:YafY family transcriptional regulator [Steroidobacteraceae bacterium]